MTPANYRLVEITGDSIAANNNQLAAEGEIGAGRDVTTIVPGGFANAGAINGNLRARAMAAFLDGSMGTNNLIAAGTAPVTAAYNAYLPTNTLPYYTIEKRVGTTGNLLLTLQLTDAIINTFSFSANSGALSTFSAGIMAAGENYISAPLVDDTAVGQPWSYTAASNDLLVFHGGRIQAADAPGYSGGGGTVLVENDNFMSLEVAINNNVQGDEYTIRPSRFVHSFTEGIRDIEVNMTIVFNDFHQYQQYTYGASGTTAPGYHLYAGQLDFILANWQLSTGDLFNTTGGDVPTTNAQAVHSYMPNVVYAGFPVTLATGRIVVTTSGRAIAPVGTTTPVLEVDVRPSGSAF